jgi:hypothetical protein
MGTLTREEIELLMDRAANWPEAAQAELVRLMDDLEQKHLGVYRLTDEERGDLEASLQEIVDGEVAPDEEVAAVFNRYR